MKGSIPLIKHESISKETQMLLHEEVAVSDQQNHKVRVGARKDGAAAHLRTICAKFQRCCSKFALFSYSSILPNKRVL